MTDEILVAQAEWLPQYASEIPAAKARIDAHAAAGTRFKTMEGFGAWLDCTRKRSRKCPRRRKRLGSGFFDGQRVSAIIEANFVTFKHGRAE